MHKPGGLYLVVENEAQFDEFTNLGWLALPPAHVEEPKHVTLWDARAMPAEAPKDDDKSDGGVSVSDLSADEAKALIASADAEQLEAIKADELAGKNRKGVLLLIEKREADLLDD